MASKRENTAGRDSRQVKRAIARASKKSGYGHKEKRDRGNTYWKLNGLEISIGNQKLGTNTAIWNPGGSATDCEAWKLGLCQLCKLVKANKRGKARVACYAMGPEIQYKKVLAFRRRQETFFQTHTAEEIADVWIDMLSRGKRLQKILKLRLSESGDIRNQDDLDKLYRVVRYLKLWYRANGKTLLVYGYSAMSHLSFNHPELIVFKGSGHDRANGQCIVIPTAADLPKGFRLCRGDCRKCSLCAVNGVNIAIPLHLNAVAEKEFEKIRKAA